MDGSPKWKLNGTDWWKGLRGLAITLIAGAAVEMLTQLSAMLQACQAGSDACQLDLGPYNLLFPLLVSAAGFVLEMARRWATDYSK